jgi:hypothetical protein
MFNEVPYLKLIFARLALWRPGFSPGEGQVGFVMEKWHRVDFLQVNQFLLPILIPPTAPDSLIILLPNAT